MIDTFWLFNPNEHGQARNIVEMHRNVCTMLGSSRHEAGALWAFDNQRTLIIRSHEVPDVEAINEVMIGHGVVEPLLTFYAMAEVPESFTVGESFPFQITAHTVKRDSSTRKLVPVDPGEWLGQRAEANGFEIERLNWRTFKARGGGHGKRICYHAAAYTGELTITDPDAFADAMRNGIGRGKGYGMGLLTLG